MILQNVLLPINCLRHNLEVESRSVKGVGDFLASIKESLDMKQESSFCDSTRLIQGRPASEKGYKSYVESLKNSLLAGGKPLTSLSLKGKESFVLKKFLFHCGFSREGIEKILEGLADNNPKGEIDLSQFLNKVAEFEPHKKKASQPASLDISVVPYVESILRSFGLSPKELGHAFSSAKTECGNLDLKRFVIELKQINNQIKQADPEKSAVDATIDRDMFVKVLRKIEGAGIRIPDKETGAQITIKDLITALERITGDGGEGGQLPGDLKTTIDQIVEKAAVPAEMEESVSPLQTSSKLRLAALYSHEITDKRNGVSEKTSFPSISEERNISAGNDTALSVSNKKDKTGARENILTLIDKNPSVDAENGQEKSKAPFPLRSAESFPGSDIPSGAANFSSSDMVNSAKQESKMTREPLPAYLLNQVGRQISRSILRGESVVKLQLHPPELGGVKVDMDINGRTLKLGMIIENSSVKELLLSSAHELKQALVEQGIKLDKLDVQVNYDSGHSLNNSNESSGRKQSRGKEANWISSIEESISEESKIMQRIMLRGDRLVDLLA